MTELLRFQKAKLTRAANKYKEKHGIEFELLFGLTGGAAGQACFRHTTQKSKVRLNMGFAADNFDELIGQTLPHEIAHILALIKYGRKGGGHGNAWKEMMEKLGKPADRLHKMDSSAIYTSKLYCDCQTHHVSKVMWGKVHRGSERKCKTCKTRVTTRPSPNQK